MHQKIYKALTQNLSYTGLFIGSIFLSLSLTPSLIPRTWMFQGIVSGFSFISGYGIGVILNFIWNYLELPCMPNKYRKIVNIVLILIATGFLVYFLSKTGIWQNRLRELAGLEKANVTYPTRTLMVALALSTVILLIVRILILLGRFIYNTITRYIPKRYGRFIGILLLLWLYGSIMSGMLTRGIIKLASSGYDSRDITTDAGAVQPESKFKSGSSESYVNWETLGRQGRNFVSSGPSKLDIEKSTNNSEAKEPIRVYVGLKSAEDLKKRADLLLQELVRTDAFQRKVLVVATSTGTGWIDPNGADTLEYIHGGDTAIASMQYSYLPSWVSLLSDTESAKAASIAMFNPIHEYWQKLDKDKRPKLYLYGLSLGSYGSEAAASWVSLTNDPINGALWVGPPFVNQFKNQIVQDRDEGSPAWQPMYKNGSVIRFTGKENSLYKPTGEWKENRFIYLQHGSDPVALFSVDSFYNEPEWLSGERAPDLPKDMNWYPGVTFWQLIADILNGEVIPDGYGHKYTTDSYINAWLALTQPENWNEEKEEKVRKVFEERLMVGN